MVGEHELLSEWNHPSGRVVFLWLSVVWGDCEWSGVGGSVGSGYCSIFCGWFVDGGI